MNESKVFFAFLCLLGYDTIVIISYIDREGAAEVLKNSSYLLKKAGLSFISDGDIHYTVWTALSIIR